MAKQHSLCTKAATLTLLGALCACNGLSDREKELVGKYYNTALSDMKPEIELNDDRSAVVRAIRPGDLVYSVDARWEATADSLILIPDTTSIAVEEGDPAAVGHVPARLAWPIVKYNDQTLTSYATATPSTIVTATNSPVAPCGCSPLPTLNLLLSI